MLTVKTGTQKERTIDCVESGQGPAVLFLPGSYSTTAAWRQVQRHLSPGYRLVTTSLCGYGGTTDTRSLQDCGIEHEVQLVQEVVRHIGQPVHLVGHSFGGTVALAAALSRTADIASLSLFEANPIPLIREHDGGRLYDETVRMSQAFEAAVNAGEQNAPARVIDFWGGPGVFAAMPDAVKAYCRETATVNVLDWRTVTSEVKARDCAALDIPVLLVRGGEANPAMVAITDTLRACLPDVRPFAVEGAGHFLITSHAARCAELLSAFLDEAAA
ncbi:Pimeloyl-ACP methyl ester carboxylesterase [Polaromonas sp. YR568]|uniref:alpha/beta fold hydrolase n=1 Tax=Polaromonas sp. YR568 TaxID=1855301 RepID=UPI0008F0C19A|nr:alpha/beta hydrolase [Polaromonas sp. YR568]SFU49416.1 Pimeloyl-ACP methyl ester carboxylesterase [Polaromonas sp. YR568]